MPEPQESSQAPELLARFIERGDEAAFETLVQRYGPLVFSLCKRVLTHEQDAEDAFQATFLVLARKAASISRRDRVGSWLYSVAYHIAQHARDKKARRPMLVSNLTGVAAAERTPEVEWRDLRPVLDDEVHRLPDKYRVPFLMYYFEGMTTEQVAAQLGCPLGTIVTRLSRARDRLRGRLRRRGVAMSAGVLLALIAAQARAASPPPWLLTATARAAELFVGAKGTTPAIVPAGAVALADRFLRRRRAAITRRVVGAGVIVGLVLVVVGLVAVAQPPSAQPLADPAGQANPDFVQLQGTWRATRVEIGGRPFTDAGSTMTFKGREWNLDCRIDAGAGPQPPFLVSAVFDLVPGESPRAIDFSRSVGKKWPGIFEFNGNKLRLCFNCANQDRPTQFASRKGLWEFCYELERVNRPTEAVVAF
ncbi:MAG: sigma-70 family RNA polymerase sigma factor [Gemmataceae bacterium]